MTKRRRRKFTEIEVVETLLHQGTIIICRHCKQPITLVDVRSGNVEKEHLHEIELDGPDQPFNCRFSHKARPCHATVTHGAPGVFAGSSRHRIAKATEPARIEKFQVRKKPLDAETVSVSPGRCRRCGEYPESCSCQRTPRRPSFSRARG